MNRRIIGTALAIVLLCFLSATAFGQVWREREFWESYPQSEILGFIVYDHIDINASDELNNTFLMDAVRHSEDSDFISILIWQGADINAQSDYGATPLGIAARLDKLDIVNELIKEGADIYTENVYGETPFVYALEYMNSREVITAFLNAGQDINARESDDDSTPLMHAAYHNTNPDIIRTLIELGANVNAVNEREQTALSYAILGNENTQIINELVQAGADMFHRDAQGRSLLDRAMQRNLEIRRSFSTNKLRERISNADDHSNYLNIAAFIRAGADISELDDRANTPLMRAVRDNFHIDIVTALVEEGADIEGRNMNGWTPLMLAAQSNSHPEIIAYLIEAGAQVNATTEYGMTPLMIASLYNPHSDVVMAILESGANYEAVNSRNFSAWDFIQYNEALERESDAYREMRSKRNQQNANNQNNNN